jgi:hypothetical protein
MFGFIQVVLAAIPLASHVAAQPLSYAPINATCPADLVRFGNNGLSPQESGYIDQRKVTAAESLRNWLVKVNFTDFNATEFLANETNAPITAIAFSGGGYRAMLNGGGVFQGSLTIARNDGRTGWTSISEWGDGRVSSEYDLYWRIVRWFLADWGHCSTRFRDD